jgi:hypothetical protein
MLFKYANRFFYFPFAGRKKSLFFSKYEFNFSFGKGKLKDLSWQNLPWEIKAKQQHLFFHFSDG